MVQLVSPPAWNPPPTVLAPVSVAASANQGLSSRDATVCRWSNAAVWITTIIIMRSDVLVDIYICINYCSAQRYNGKTVNNKIVMCSYNDMTLQALILGYITLQPGEIVFGDGCSKLCRCQGNYTLECVDNSCEPTEECREVNGVSGCYPKGNNVL